MATRVLDGKQVSNDELNTFLPAIPEGPGVLPLLCHQLPPREKDCDEILRQETPFPLSTHGSTPEADGFIGNEPCGGRDDAACASAAGDLAAHTFLSASSQAPAEEAAQSLP